MCVAFFKKCCTEDRRMAVLKLSTEFVEVNNHSVHREEERIIELATTNERIQKCYFKACSDILKTCLENENLPGKIGACLSVRGIFVSRVIYFPRSIVLVGNYE